MRTRLAGFVFVLVFIMAMTYSGFMVWAQETTGQTAELPARPWWHCDYHADVPPWSIYVPCTEARKRTATAVAIAMAYETRVVTPTVQHIATLVALGTPNAEAIATYRVPIGYERATKEALSVECRRQFPPLTRRNRDRLHGCLNSLSSTWSRLASHSRMKVLALIRIQHTREASIIETTATLQALVTAGAAYPGTATAIATEWLGKVLLTPTHTPTVTPIPWWQCDYHAKYPPPDNPTLVYVPCVRAAATATAIAVDLAYISTGLQHTTATAEAHETRIAWAVAAATDAPWWSVTSRGRKTATAAVRELAAARANATYAATRNLSTVTSLQRTAEQFDRRSTRAANHYYGRIHRTATALSWTATPTPRPTPTYTVTPTFTATPTPSPTPTSTATLPYTVTPTFTATPTATATPAPATPTSTATPKLTPTQPGVCVSEPCSPSSNPAPAPQRPPGGGSGGGGGGGSSSPAPAPTPTVPPTATATPIATPLPTVTPCGDLGNPCGPVANPQSPLPTPTPKHKLYFPFQDK